MLKDAVNERRLAGAAQGTDAAGKLECTSWTAPGDRAPIVENSKKRVVPARKINDATPVRDPVDGRDGAQECVLLVVERQKVVKAGLVLIVFAPAPDASVNQQGLPTTKRRAKSSNKEACKEQRLEASAAACILLSVCSTRCACVGFAGRVGSEMCACQVRISASSAHAGSRRCLRRLDGRHRKADHLDEGSHGRVLAASPPETVASGVGAAACPDAKRASGIAGEVAEALLPMTTTTACTACGAEHGAQGGSCGW